MSQYSTADTQSLDGMCPVARKTLIGTKINSLTAVHVTHTITLAALQAQAAGVKTYTLRTVLPANARLLGAYYTLTYIDNAGDTGVLSIKSGGTDDNGLIALTDVSTGGSGASAIPLVANGAQGTVPFVSLSGQTIATVLTSDVDLNTLTKGAFQLDFFYLPIV